MKLAVTVVAVADRGAFGEPRGDVCLFTAAYAGTFDATKSQFTRAGFPAFSTTVVGTPIYIRQI